MATSDESIVTGPEAPDCTGAAMVYPQAAVASGRTAGGTGSPRQAESGVADDGAPEQWRADRIVDASVGSADRAPGSVVAVRLNPVIATLFARECKRVWRSPMTAVSSVLFFVVAASLFALALGPDPVLLRAIGPGVLWVAALLSILLAAPRLFAADHAQGTLAQMLL